MTELADLLESAFDARAAMLDDPQHRQALRLFNGFFEGCPDLLADVYGRTLVLYNYAQDPEDAQPALQTARETLLARCPWLTCVVQKTRAAVSPARRAGEVVWGANPERRVREGAVWYALDLTMNQDASFYLDTRGLRVWLYEHCRGLRVLNTFAYTGSLGVAALAGGARQVLQTDINRRFLNLAKDSCTLNGLPVVKADYLTGDFFKVSSNLRRKDERFDVVIADPPFFSSTPAGRVDLAADSLRLLNKLRPLVADGGWLVAVNNALFLSGADYDALLGELCADGYLSLEERIEVPEDITGFPSTRQTGLPVSPAPFNHATKIAILRVRRK